MPQAEHDEAVAEAPLRLQLAGRAFRDAGRTMAAVQDVWLAPHLNKAGLYDYLKGSLQMGEDEDPGAFFERLTLRISESGRLFHIAAGMLEEDGKSVPEDPDAFEPFILERVRFLASLRDPADRATLTRHLMELVLRFFASGLASLRTFRTSSASEPGADSAPARPSAEVMSPSPA